jgi:hypothetical protein
MPLELRIIRSSKPPRFPVGVRVTRVAVADGACGIMGREPSDSHLRSVVGCVSLRVVGIQCPLHFLSRNGLAVFELCKQLVHLACFARVIVI